MKNLTVRDVDVELAAALDRERRRSGKSLNRTVLGLLRRALGLGDSSVRTNGLRELAGGWTDAEAAAFDEACRDFEQVDEDLWR